MMFRSEFMLKSFKMASRLGVMLGIPDGKIAFEDAMNNTWSTNKFGGFPTWINKPPEVYPQCSLCHSQLPLVAQIYCPLENSLYHRVLYLFGCVNTSCWNKNESWKVLRCQTFVQEDMPKDEKIENEDTWCEDADNWGEDESFEETNTASKLEQLEEETRKLNLDEKEYSETSYKQTSAPISQKGTPACSLKPLEFIHFVPYYITVLEESHLLREAGELTRSEKRLLNDYQAREGIRSIEEMADGSAAGDWGGEKYEITVAKHGDKIFQKFKKHLSLCPKQCLRYIWNGEPLRMTSQGLGTIPPCNSCGEKRVFELQLMPALVSLLEIDREGNRGSFVDSKARSEEYTPSKRHRDMCVQDEEFMNLNSTCIEFGTVFVYTCSQGCWSDDVLFQEEYAIVHSDPDQHLFKNAK